MAYPREPHNFPNEISKTKTWMDEWDGAMQRRGLQEEVPIPPRYWAMTAKPKPKAKPVLKKSLKPEGDRLKAFLEAKKTPSIVLGEVDRYLQDKVKDRRTDIIHPSEMASDKWCSRATWLRLTGHKPPAKPHRLQTNLVFGEGHDIHAKWQQWFKEMGIIYGRWTCEACHRTDLCQITELPRRGCPNQVEGNHLWSYGEVPYEDPAYRIAGHSDGLIYPDGRDHLIEVKSVGPGTLRKLGVAPEDAEDEYLYNQFSRVTHVLGDHYRQLQIYMRLSQTSERPVTRGLVIYEQKADQQVREFPIEYDERATDDLFQRAVDIIWAIDKGREVQCSKNYDGDCYECRGWT